MDVWRESVPNNGELLMAALVADCIGFGLALSKDVVTKTKVTNGINTVAEASQSAKSGGTVLKRSKSGQKPMDMPKISLSTAKKTMGRMLRGTADEQLPMSRTTIRELASALLITA